MQKNVRTTSGEEAHFLSVPTTVKDLSQAPGMKLEIVHLQQRGAAANPYDAEVLPRMMVRNGTGLFHAHGAPISEYMPLHQSPFLPEEAKDVVLCHAKYAEWLLYGFIARAYGICLLYYNVCNTNMRGIVELGRDFSSMQVNIEDPEAGRYSIHIGRNLLSTWAPLKCWRKPYMSCQATIAHRPHHSDMDAISIRPQNYDGIDTVYIDQRSAN